MLFKTSHRGLYNRPVGAFSLNRESPHLTGLVAGWWATQNASGLLTPMRGGILPVPPIIISGSPTTEVMAPAASARVEANGMIAQSESDGNVGGIARAFDTGLPGALDGLSKFSIAYWTYCYAATSLDVAGHLSWWGQGDGSTSSFCEIVDGSIGLFIRGVIDIRAAGLTDQANRFAWTHVVHTFGSTYRYYTDGRNRSSSGVVSGTVTAAATNGFYIGGQPAGDNGPLAVPARWADFRIYNYELSAREVVSLYTPATRWNLYWQPSTRRYFSIIPPSDAKILIRNRAYV